MSSKVEKLTRKQKNHLLFLETALSSGGSITPSSLSRASRAISTETGAQLVAMGAVTEHKDKKRKVYSITDTGKHYLDELERDYINDASYLLLDFNSAMRSFQGGSSTGAFMLTAHAWDYDESKSALGDALENLKDAYSQQQARLLILGKLLVDEIDSTDHKLIDFRDDAQEPSHPLIALRPTDFDAQMIGIIRDYFQQRYKQKLETAETLEVSNSFVISASLFALASLIEVSQGTKESTEEREL